MKAHGILRDLRLIETSPRLAAYALVVVRSGLYNPLTGMYDSLAELEQDAEAQLNIAGPQYHVYLFQLDDNLRPYELDHKSFDAED